MPVNKTENVGTLISILGYLINSKTGVSEGTD